MIKIIFVEHPTAVLAFAAVYGQEVYFVPNKPSLLTPACRWKCSAI